VRYWLENKCWVLGASSLFQAGLIIGLEAHSWVSWVFRFCIGGNTSWYRKKQMAINFLLEKGNTSHYCIGKL